MVITNAVIGWSIAGLAALVFRWWSMRNAKKRGVLEERVRHAEENLDQANEANAIKNRVATDSDERDRVRDKFDG